MDLNDRTVVITGAGSGIGWVACEVFAAAGATVVAADIHQEPAQAAADAVDGIAVAGDVSDPDTWDELLDAAGGRLGAVYLNAGLYGDNGPIEDLDLETYQRTIDANIGGVVLGTRACVPALRANGGGAVVVTASVAGIVAFDGNPLYTLSKQAVAGFVRAIAPSLSNDGITIDAVCPGIVDTPMTTEALGGASADDLGIGLIDPTDIARAALDLATTDGTGRCRAVRGTGGPPVDWEFPTWVDLAKA